MDKLIYDIDKYLSDINVYFEGMIFELDDLEHDKSSVHTVQGIINYFKDEIEYSIEKYEIHCRALRDKLTNG